jgi:hypothetical protein
MRTVGEVEHSSATYHGRDYEGRREEVRRHGIVTCSFHRDMRQKKKNPGSRLIGHTGFLFSETAK